jgi:hypothetical protein
VVLEDMVMGWIVLIGDVDEDGDGMGEGELQHGIEMGETLRLYSIGSEAVMPVNGAGGGACL